MSEDPRPFTVNGRFLTQKVTGVQRYAREIISRLDHLLTEENPGGLRGTIVGPPGMPADCRFSAMSVRRTTMANGVVWEQLILPFYLRGPLLNLCNQGPLSLKRQIVCIHDLNTRIAPDSYSRAFRMAYGVTQPVLARRAAKLVTVSKYSANMLAQSGLRRESDISVVPNGHEHVRLWNAGASNLALAARGRPYVFVLGSRAPHKNVQVLYSIAPALDTLGVDLLVAGGAAGIFAQGALAKPPENVVELGFVSDDDLAALFEHALCFAFPSITEGFGLPVLEALALGCPVVAADIPALREVAGDSALYADPRLPAAWFDAISALKNQKELSETLRQTGLARARLFSWLSGARTYLELLRDLSD